MTASTLYSNIESICIVTDVHLKFDSKVKQDSTCLWWSAVPSSLTLTAKHIFHHIVLMETLLCFCLVWLLAHYNEHFSFAFGPKYKWAMGWGTGGECELTFQTQSACIKPQEIPKQKQHWGENKWNKIQIELTRRILFKVVIIPVWE